VSKKGTTLAIAAIVGLAAILSGQGASIAAGALLHPSRTKVRVPTPARCDDTQLKSADISLRGWRCRAEGARRGVIVYLHGIADNRASGHGVIQRYTAKGLDVVAFDSRAHGDSGGEVCTYGYYEKADLRHIIDTLPEGPVVLIGTSLGAAVALQEAADDPRVTGIVVAEVFSDLRTVARERAPFILPRRVIAKAFQIAEQRGRFTVDAVNPANAAKRIAVPVLLIHGANDKDTKPAHSQRVHDALAGPKRLILVSGAGHNRSLSGGTVWTEIDRWIEDVVVGVSTR
jgi:pimeloyl-ACP methyl ester carboxylesterase